MTDIARVMFLTKNDVGKWLGTTKIKESKITDRLVFTFPPWRVKDGEP